MSVDYTCSNEDCQLSGNDREVSPIKCDDCGSPMISEYIIEAENDCKNQEFFAKYPHLEYSEDPWGGMECEPWE